MSTPPTKITVYGSTLSPFVRAVLVTLEALGIKDYENISVIGFKGETRTPEYLKVKLSNRYLYFKLQPLFFLNPCRIG